MRFKKRVQNRLYSLRNSWKSPRVIGGLFIFLMLIGSFACYMAKPMNAVAVTVNGQQIGFVYDQSTGKSLMEAASQDDYQITYDQVTLKTSDYLQSALKQRNLDSKLNKLYDAYEMKVDGSTIAILPSADDIDNILKEYQDHFIKPSETNIISETKITENVTCAQTSVKLSDIQSPEQVLKSLIADQTLQVVCKGTYTAEETIPYSTITKKDYTLAYAAKNVITEGSNGLKSVTVSYEQQNDKIIEKHVISEKTIKTAVDEVIAVGSSARPITVASSATLQSRGISDVVDYALSYVGSRYRFGGSSPKGFDCSGFVMYVYKAAGVSLPHSSFSQYASGTAITKSDLQPGDLVFFSTYTRGASHVGIYIGDGKIVHAYNYSAGVTISSLSSLSSRYLGARRY